MLVKDLELLAEKSHPRTAERRIPAPDGVKLLEIGLCYGVRRFWPRVVLLPAFMLACNKGPNTPQDKECVAAIAGLADRIRKEGVPSDLAFQLEGLCPAAPEYLMASYARRERNEMPGAPNEASMKWVLEACPDFDDVQRRRSDVSWEKRTRILYEGCEFARFGIEHPDPGAFGRPFGGTPIPWAVHVWMVGIGAKERDAKQVTEAVLALDLEWSLRE